MEILKAIILMIVEALAQALPEMLKDKARVVEEDAGDKDVSERIVRAAAEFEGVDFEALESGA